MPKVSSIGVHATSREIDAETGKPVMRVAVGNDVDGIIGEYGGNLMCATCHV